MRHHPLEIPEILSHIGHSLPLFITEQLHSTSSYSGVSTNNKQARTVFCPKDLQTCLLVCKFWYKTLLPVLWNRYSCPAMDSVPAAVIDRFSPLFRTFDAHGCDFTASILGGGSYRSSRSSGSAGQAGLTLVEDDGHGDGDGSDGAEQKQGMQRQLVCVRRSMALDWKEKKKDNALNPDHFVLLKTTSSGTQDLRQSRWTRSQGTLANMIRKVVTILEPVSPNVVDPVSTTNTPQEAQQPPKPSFAGPKKKRRGKSGQSETAIAIRYFPGLTCRLLFPLIETVSADNLREGAEVLELVVCCPNLRTLIVSVAKPLDLVALADGLSTACPLFQSLTLYIRDTSENVTETMGRDQVAPFIQTCSTSGLVYLTISTIYEMDNELTSSILIHAAKLDELSISMNSRVYMSPSGLYRVLYGCKVLRCLHLSGRMDTSPDELLRILKSLPRTNYAGLERLNLDIVFTRDSPLQSAGGFGDAAEEPDTFFISSNMAFMGWCCSDELPNRLERRFLSELFESVQGLQKLRRLVWAFQGYSRSVEKNRM
ncbi:MAG: hypothetical protein JOS17DRAFT_767688 [Linnemannia elongata]|nr:MAG: hypothetical protein JOS17DRAFT_767688 [Linnemannia elongata]